MKIPYWIDLFYICFILLGGGFSWRVVDKEFSYIRKKTRHSAKNKDGQNLKSRMNKFHRAHSVKNVEYRFQRGKTFRWNENTTQTIPRDLKFDFNHSFSLTPLLCYVLPYVFPFFLLFIFLFVFLYFFFEFYFPNYVSFFSLSIWLFSYIFLHSFHYPSSFFIHFYPSYFFLSILYRPSFFPSFIYFHSFHFLSTFILLILHLLSFLILRLL